MTPRPGAIACRSSAALGAHPGGGNPFSSDRRFEAKSGRQASLPSTKSARQAAAVTARKRESKQTHCMSDSG